ncbi:dihydrofolate reductase family protein [Pseudonocardia sp. KRD291]|uniref:dihydrofolate reductase family protein n=1 Tax=Pseudonocardia sp. KRD291 TaxID=2792007 RepID=UPI001C4A4F58|nr:dihydrofolate reductase family protein [Pseudonocardia sp. KRD291]MBW0103106.1 dihydrofolate reductase family protein [Pseudonocardia sp. KRD291]
MIHQIWPSGDAGPLTPDQLEELYRYPDDRTRLVVNFVSSADGAVTVHGTAAGLGTPPDREVLDLGTDLADVVLVGAGTAIAEGFTGVKPDERAARRRARSGLREVAVTAVVTASGRSLPVDAPVLTDTLVPTIVFTCGSAPADVREGWSAAGAEVVCLGDGEVDLRAVVAELARRGLHRINCMGGPTLFGSLAEAGLVDELRLTLAPFLVSGQAGRIAHGVGMDPARLELVSAITGDDTLLMRYRVRDPSST